jgi:site-specific recombinase XerD
MEQQQILDRLEQDLALRGRAKNTVVSYLKNARRYLDHIDRPIEDTDEDDIRDFIGHLASDGMSAATTNHYLSSVLFLYEITLNRPMNRRQVPFMKLRQPAVSILSRDELATLIATAGNMRTRAALMLGIACK